MEQKKQLLECPFLLSFFFVFIFTCSSPLEHRQVSVATLVPSCTSVAAVTEPTNYMRSNKKIIHRVDDLANLSPYNPLVREITTDFKPTYIPAKIVISSAVTITSYIKVRVTNTSEFKYSYYKSVLNKSSGSI
jgi:hypothetical protein